MLRMGFLTGHELTWMPEALQILRDELPNIDVMISKRAEVMQDSATCGIVSFCRSNVCRFTYPTSPPVPSTTKPPGLRVRDKSQASHCIDRARPWYGKPSCRNRECIFVSPRCYLAYRVRRASCVRQ